MSAEVITLADYVTSMIQEAFTAVGQAATIATEFAVEDDAGEMEGIFVDVYAWKYTDLSPAYPSNRREDSFQVQINVIFRERFADVGKPNAAWVKDRIRLVRDLVFGPMNNYIRPDGNFHANEYWSLGATVQPVFDPDLIREQKVFWSEVSAIFQKLLT